VTGENEGRPGEDLATAAVWATACAARGENQRAERLAAVLDVELGRPAGATLGVIRGLLSEPSTISGGSTCAC
jgi:hypothetical protein